MATNPPYEGTIFLNGSQRLRDILFDQKDRAARLFQLAQNGIDLGHYHRRQAFARLVDQQQVRLPYQHARHGEHLLLAARRRGAVLPAALVQSREAAIDFLQRRLVGASKRAIRPPRRGVFVPIR
jgi:hypothetical protein